MFQAFDRAFDRNILGPVPMLLFGAWVLEAPVSINITILPPCHVQFSLMVGTPYGFQVHHLSNPCWFP